MTVQEQLLIEQRVTNEAKSPLVAYLLLIFLWGFGVHRMYLGRWVSGIVMAVLWGLGWLTAPILIGWPLLGFVCLWVIIDLFLVPGMIQEENAVNRQRIASELARGSPEAPARRGRGSTKRPARSRRIRHCPRSRDASWCG